MALVGVGLFWLVRAVLAAIPGDRAATIRSRNGRRRRRWRRAAFYLVISGAAPSAMRAFVMLAMMLVAILLDRPALSMRSLALAAAILLLLRPESHHRAGLSDVVRGGGGLIAVAEWEQRASASRRAARFYRYLHGIVADQPGGQPGHHALRASFISTAPPITRCWAICWPCR